MKPQHISEMLSFDWPNVLPSSPEKIPSSLAMASKEPVAILEPSSTLLRSRLMCSTHHDMRGCNDSAR